MQLDMKKIVICIFVASLLASCAKWQRVGVTTNDVSYEVDENSIRRQGERVIFRSRVQYPTRHFPKNGLPPHTQVTSLWAVDCQSGLYRLLSTELTDSVGNVVEKKMLNDKTQWQNPPEQGSAMFRQHQKVCLQ